MNKLAAMKEGGRKLAQIRGNLMRKVAVGVSAWEIEEEAGRQIEKAGGVPSFKMVPGYSWSTCVNVNEGVVHGIPSKDVVFAKEDVVSVDLGMYYEGYHTDTSDTVYLGRREEIKRFLKAGQEALKAGIANARVGGVVGDISRGIEQTLKKYGLNPVKSLVGHGIGKNLHEDPYIPCFVSGARVEREELFEGMALAIEVMYSAGSAEVVGEADGWTIRTKDGKIASLYEDTVMLTRDGVLVLTKAP